MPTIVIDGIGDVVVGSEFLSLTPEQQHATVQQIAASAKPSLSQGRALLEGYLQGAGVNFADEVYGASKASGLPDFLGGFRAPVGAARLGYEYLSGQPGEATATYEKSIAEKRAIQQQAQQQHPGTFMAGELAGSVVLPGGAVARGATMGARIGRGAAVGAGYGAAYGAGGGEDLTSRATGAAYGAGTGAVLGAAAAPVVEGAMQLGRVAIGPFANAVRGAINPKGEAARRVASTLDMDMRGDPGRMNRLTQAEFQANPEASIMDLGGEMTRALGRSSANTSPVGRDILNQTVDARYEGQAGRVVQWFRGLYNYPNATAQRAAMDHVEKTVNRKNYDLAYRDGDKPLWSPDLERLTSSPDVQDAIKAAGRTGKSRAVNQGYGGFNSPVAVTPDGQLQFNRGSAGTPTYPNLQFWDYVRRELSDSAKAAARSGRNEEASRIGQQASALNAELDNLVPAYQQARSGAASFFGAENALEAGEKFVVSRMGNAEAKAALEKMSPVERGLFQDGFASQFIDVLNSVPDRRNVLNTIAQSPEAREKLVIALGPKKAAEIEARMRVEGIMDFARRGLQGNSTTARQLAELGLAGGAGGLGAYGAYNADPKTAVPAALTAALLAGRRGIDRRVAENVARLLASRNTSDVSTGIKLVASNRRMLEALRAFDSRVAIIGAQQAN